jgi:multidrug resistance protein, MATE family
LAGGSQYHSSVKEAFRESRATLLLAIPIIIGQLSQMLMGITDSVMIGRTGTVPLAASSFGGGVFGVFFIVGVGLLVPVSVFASRSRGAGRHDEAAEYLRHGLALALCAGLAGVGIIVFLSRHLGWFHQRPEVVAAVNPFFLLIGLSLVPVLAFLALRQFSEALGRPWMPMAVMLGGIVLNAFLNWVLIYGHLGMPSLGLTGSGTATLISRTLSSAVIFMWMRLDPSMRAAWPKRWLAPISWSRMRTMLRVGLPTAGSLLFEGGAFATATVMMGWLGAVALAANQIALSCAALTFMFPLGLSIAVGIRIGAAVGAGHHSKVRPIWAGAAGLSVAQAALVTLLFVACGRTIASFFVGDTAVIATATRLLVVVGIFQIFDGAQVINSAGLRCMTDVRIPAAITFVAYWVIAIPLAYVLGIRGGFGPPGIWTGIASGLAAAAILLGARLIRLTRPGSPSTG